MTKPMAYASALMGCPPAFLTPVCCGVSQYTVPFFGWNIHATTDDFGQLQQINFASVAASLSGGAE